MNYLKIISDILSAEVNIPVGALQMAQKQPLPYVVFDVDTIQPEQTKARYTALDVVSVTVLTFHNDLDSAQTVANTVRIALTTAKQQGVQSAYLQYTGLDYINEINAYVVTQSYSVRIPYTDYEIPPLTGIGAMIIGTDFTIA